MGNILYRQFKNKSISSGDICWQWAYGLNKSKTSYIIIDNTIKYDARSFDNMWNTNDKGALSITYTFDMYSHTYHTSIVDDFEDVNDINFTSTLSNVFRNYFDKVRTNDFRCNQMTINWFDNLVEYKMDKNVKSICIFYENHDECQTLVFEPNKDTNDFMYNVLELSVDNGSIVSICGDTAKQFNYFIKPIISKHKMIILTFRHIELYTPVNIDIIS